MDGGGLGDGDGQLMEFLRRFVVDFGATRAAGNMTTGERLGRPARRRTRLGPLDRMEEKWRQKQ
jgi:hypothetical protein